MSDIILAVEPTIRLSVFLGMLAAMAIWELAAPRRRMEIPRLVRWSNNLALVVVDTVLVRLAFPVLAVGFAALAQERGWGLFNALDVPQWIAVIAAVLLLDLAIYLQHVLFHAVPGLWRFHRMHHADLEFDFSTGVRFHPIEIVLSMIIKLMVVMALGAPPIAVLAFEVILNATSIFNHSNIRLPGRADALVRLIVVTPDMHRVHHSIHPSETNSNFGFNFPWWDRLLGTYLAQPRDGHREMTIGLDEFRSARDVWLDAMLIQPFVGKARKYPINRSEGD